MSRNILRAAAAVAFVALLQAQAFADKRAYVWTYQYQTVERGVAELEHYLTLSTPDFGNFKGQTSTEHQVEIEIGMNDRFDVGIYQVFEQTPDTSFAYKGFKVRGRYRFGERGDYFLDPLLYVEYKGTPDFDEHALELKMILARDLGRVNVAINPILEFEHEDGDWEVEPEYAVGISYGVSELMRVGLEAKGSENGHYLGPVFSHGKDHLWIALGSAFKLAGVKEGKPELQFRSIMGIQF